jgi:hypothetical protein
MLPHDALTGESWMPAGKRVRPVAAAGGRVFHFRQKGAERRVLCSAKVTMPAKAP